MNSTLLYYDSNAKEYSDSTVNAEFSAVQERFLSFIPAKGVILILVAVQDETRSIF